MTPQTRRRAARSPAALSAATHRERPHCPAWSGAPPTTAEFQIKSLAVGLRVVDAAGRDAGDDALLRTLVQPFASALDRAQELLEVDLECRQDRVGPVLHLEPGLPRLSARLVEDVVDLLAIDPDLIGQGDGLRVVNEVVELVDEYQDVHSASRVYRRDPGRPTGGVFKFDERSEVTNPPSEKSAEHFLRFILADSRECRGDHRGKAPGNGGQRLRARARPLSRRRPRSPSRRSTRRSSRPGWPSRRPSRRRARECGSAGSSGTPTRSPRSPGAL